MLLVASRCTWAGRSVGLVVPNRRQVNITQPGFPAEFWNQIPWIVHDFSINTSVFPGYKYRMNMNIRTLVILSIVSCKEDFLMTEPVPPGVQRAPALILELSNSKWTLSVVPLMVIIQYHLLTIIMRVQTLRNPATYLQIRAYDTRKSSQILQAAEMRQNLKVGWIKHQLVDLENCLTCPYQEWG